MHDGSQVPPPLAGSVIAALRAWQGAQYGREGLLQECTLPPPREGFALPGGTRRGGRDGTLGGRKKKAAVGAASFRVGDDPVAYAAAIRAFASSARIAR